MGSSLCGSVVQGMPIMYEKSHCPLMHFRDAVPCCCGPGMAVFLMPLSKGCCMRCFLLAFPLSRLVALASSLIVIVRCVAFWLASYRVALWSALFSSYIRIGAVSAPMCMLCLVQPWRDPSASDNSRKHYFRVPSAQNMWVTPTPTADALL